MCQTRPLLLREFHSHLLYTGYIRRFISIAKYGGDPHLLRALSKVAVERLAQRCQMTDWDLVVPMPVDRVGFQRKGFHHTGSIAEVFGSYFQLRIVRSALSYRGVHTPQVSLNHIARWRNVANTFLALPSVVRGKKVLLIDDVVTTGATSYAATIALMEAGAQSVTLLSLARSPRWNDHRRRFMRILDGNQTLRAGAREGSNVIY